MIRSCHNLSTTRSDEPSEQQMEMTDIVERFAPGDGVHHTAIASLQLVRSGAPADTFHAIQRPALYVIVQGRQEVRLRGERHACDALECQLVAMTRPLTLRIDGASRSRPFLGIRLAIEPRELSQLIFGVDAQRPLEQMPACGLHVEPLDLPLLEAMLRMLRLLDTPRDIAALAPLAYKEILYRLLRGKQGQQLREIALLNNQAHRVVQAVEWLNVNYMQALRIDELAQRINLCTSSLHHRFKEVTGVSPLQYQKKLRLQEARRLMLQEGIEASAACYRVGYESPSQFSREYSRFFGASPRHDIALLRSLSN